MAYAVISDDSVTTPERELLVAILKQAKIDLYRYERSDIQAESLKFFQNDGKRLETICDLLDLDYRTIQNALKIT